MRPALFHLGGRVPGRPLGFAGDPRRAGPAERLVADRHAVAHRFPIRQHEVELALLGVDHDGSGRFASQIGDQIACEDAIFLDLRDERHPFGVPLRQDRVGGALEVAARQRHAQRQSAGQRRIPMKRPASTPL